MRTRRSLIIGAPALILARGAAAQAPAVRALLLSGKPPSAGGANNQWNASAKNGHITLSNSNLTATADGTISNHAAVLSTKSASGSQNVYWETTAVFVDNSFQGLGIGNSSITFADGDYLGVSTHGMNYFSGGAVYVNGASVTTLAGYSTSSVIGSALSIPNNKIWFTLNGTTWNNDIIANQNPVGNVGGLNLTTIGVGAGPYFAGCSVLQTTDAFTANFGATSFTYSVPTGFVAFL
jgi:hypothetical protein